MKKVFLAVAVWVLVTNGAPKLEDIHEKRKLSELFLVEIFDVR